MKPKDTLGNKYIVVTRKSPSLGSEFHPQVLRDEHGDAMTGNNSCDSL